MIQEHISLKSYNSFGIDVAARFFSEITSLNQLQELLQSKKHADYFLMSGGSNMLLTKDIDALVLHINLKGIAIISETENEVVLEIMAGENWHDLVVWTLDQGYGGLENLSLIPGNAGTAPIQNIGAYGVELKDVFQSCTVMEIETGAKLAFNTKECGFGYRDSIFKNKVKGKYIITSIALKLTKQNHKLRTSYGAIEAELEAQHIQKPTIQEVSKAVIAIRQRKLPDPKKLGNSGSFFKNPVVSQAQFNKFHKAHPNAPYYKVDGGGYKIPAGWLIEQAGFKGKRFGDAGVHKNQALVLVNHGDASGTQILDLATKIQEEVYQKFEIEIQTEVNIIT